MFVKTAIRAFLIFTVIFSFLAVFTPGKSLAQTEPLSCQGEITPVFGSWSNWQYAGNGLSRTRTRDVSYYDSAGTLCDSGQESQTEYAYCEQGNTTWNSNGQLDMTQGWCEGYTVTICFDGQTLEIPAEILIQYENQYTEGSCSTPVPTPFDLCANIDGVQTSVPESLHENAGNCIGWDTPGVPPPPTTSQGQVLGASTLAATGTSAIQAAIMLMVVGSALTLSSLYALKKSSF